MRQMKKITAFDLEEKIRWGILGTGFISSAMARAIQASKSGELVAIGSRQEKKAQKFAAEFNIKHAFANPMHMLESNEIDAIYLGIPNHVHANWVVLAAQAGKHVLCEKPFAVNAAQAKYALDAAKHHNIICREALMYLYHPFTEKLIKQVRDGVIGNVQCIQAFFADDIVEFANPTAGGSIMDLGCYPLSLAGLLAGAQLPVRYATPKRIYAKAVRKGPHSTDTISNAMIEYETGAHAMIHVANQYGLASQLHVIGDRGTLSTSSPWLIRTLSRMTWRNYLHQDVRTGTTTGKLPLYTYQIDAMGNAILGGRTRKSAIDWSPELILANQTALDQWRKAVGLEYELERDILADE